MAAHALANRREMMSIVAARLLPDACVCFVGIGIPSEAANLARRTHAPNIVLIYESGTIGAKPQALPLSIGDPELATSADTVVPTAEIFSTWLQGGRIEVGFLGAAQIDRFANLNSTLIGDYDSPKVRLPGAGGAPDIAALAQQTMVIMPHKKEKLVEQLDFMTSAGFLSGGDARERAGLSGGPKHVITDLAVLEPEKTTRELVVSQLLPGVTVEEVRDCTGWEVRFADQWSQTQPATEDELLCLRELKASRL